ncbi:MAG TPA: ATP-binding protein [Mycobacteriales bacterium]|jgi:anti-sigma regulatory factor (Ser/Thr protein kinase)|nr:ATP-binding protein [Mycobacteriales bacterium]
MDEVVTLPDGPEGASFARRAMKRAADLWLLDRELTETALLLVSELATNAIRHGTPPVKLSLQLDKDRLRVEVTDSSPALPHLDHPGPDQTGGRGLQIVQQLATKWGASASPRRLGKTVWFDLLRS